MRTTTKAILVLMFVSFFGIWGCGRNGNAPTANAKVRDLQTRNAKWEEDYRVVIAANGTLRKKLKANQARLSEMEQKTQQIAALKRERDELRALLDNRTSERDNVRNQLVSFQKELAGLAGRLQLAAEHITGATSTAQDTETNPLVATSTGSIAPLQTRD